MCAYQGLRNVRFSKHLACFVSLLPPFEIRLFALLPTNCLQLHSHILYHMPLSDIPEFSHFV